MMAYSAPYMDAKPSFDVHHSCFPKLVFPKHQLFPTHKMPFEDIMIRVPHDEKAICVINYNPNCFTTIVPPPSSHTDMHKFSDSIYFSPIYENVPMFKKKLPNLYNIYLTVQSMIFGTAFKKYQGIRTLNSDSLELKCRKRTILKESLMLGFYILKIIITVMINLKSYRT